jgi:thiamine biosynthesis lipoprotein
VSRSPAPQARRRVEQIMGMPVSLALRGRHADDERGRAAWDCAVASLQDADRVFSTYLPDSYICRLGRGEIDAADCPPEVAEVLALGEEARVASGGAFNVRRLGPDGRMLLDPSGVVKGWAVQRAMSAFDELIETDVCLSAGGDLQCRVADPDGAPWQIGIEDPHDPQRLIAKVPLRNGALATSGSAHRGDHIVNAVTNALPRSVASVTVLADTLTWADIDATAAYAQDRDALAWLQTRPGRSGLVVWQDGRSDSFAVPS